MKAGALRLLTVGLLAGVAEAGPQVELQDPDGHPVLALPATGDGATVFVFARTDCPITNRYAPELRRIHDRFAPLGVRFWLVYPDPGESGEAVRRHAREYGYGFAPLRDPKHALVGLAGARVTPEAAVFVPDASGPRLVYRGRIDDRNVAFGKARREPGTRDLQDVLTALAQKEPLTARTTAAVGCAIAPLE